MKVDFKTMLLSAQVANNSILGIGLDTFSTNKKLIKDSATIASVLKIDPADYRSEGYAGIRILLQNIEDARNYAPTIPIIFDGKYAGSARANESYAKEAFDFYKVDAVTVSPYGGMDTFEPFLERTDKGIFVVCKMSNNDSGEFQDQLVPMPGTIRRGELYQRVAYDVARHWNRHGNCGLVVGATYPNALRFVRDIVGDEMTILSPGAGKHQGGDIRKAVLAGKNSAGKGLILHFSSQIEDAKEPRDEARMLRDEINRYR